MPKKIGIINNAIPDEKILIADEIPEVETPQIISKPKRQISDAQREHLNNIRAKALEKKSLQKQLKKKNLLKNMMIIF